MLFRALSEKADKAVIATKVWTLSIFPDHQGPVANNCVQRMVRHLATFRAFPADLGQLIDVLTSQDVNISYEMESFPVNLCGVCLDSLECLSFKSQHI